MYIYLLHFHEPLSEINNARHYLGFCYNLENRIEQHRKGQGSRFTQVANERGIKWELVRIWEGGRNEERKLKNQRNAPRLCPICNPSIEAPLFICY